MPSKKLVPYAGKEEDAEPKPLGPPGPQEARVRKLLVKKRDTSIVALWYAANDATPGRRQVVVPEPRRMQQLVGAIICRLNQKIAKDGVVAKVGKARGTYRLYNLNT